MPGKTHLIFVRPKALQQIRHLSNFRSSQRLRKVKGHTRKDRQSYKKYIDRDKSKKEHSEK
jgi:hypothetical protein